MEILIAPDSFKPSVKSSSVAQAMVRGFAQAGDFVCRVCPLTSGGLGTLDILVRAKQGRIRWERVQRGAGKILDVRWGLLPDGTAALDVADIFPQGSKDNLKSSSWVIGQVVRQIFRYRPARILLALGDSLVPDLGMGFLTAFGAQFLDRKGAPVPPGLPGIPALNAVVLDSLIIPSIPIDVLYEAPQSFSDCIQASPGPLFPGQSERLIGFLEDHVALPLGQIPGTGAGGGLALGLAFLGATLKSGASFMTEFLSVPDEVRRVQWIVTGERKLDRHSKHHVVGSMARLGSDLNVPVVVLTQQLGEGHRDLYDDGVQGIYPILDQPRSLKQADRAMASLIEQASFRVGRWLLSLG